jgi:hypothetical protein
MATRMKALGARGVIVNGRVRDLAELKATGLQVCLFLAGSGGLRDIYNTIALNVVDCRFGRTAHRRLGRAQKQNPLLATFL